MIYLEGILFASSLIFCHKYECKSTCNREKEFLSNEHLKRLQEVLPENLVRENNFVLSMIQFIPNIKSRSTCIPFQDNKVFTSRVLIIFTDEMTCKYGPIPRSCLIPLVVLHFSLRSVHSVELMPKLLILESNIGNRCFLPLSCTVWSASKNKQSHFAIFTLYFEL